MLGVARPQRGSTSGVVRRGTLEAVSAETRTQVQRLLDEGSRIVGTVVEFPQLRGSDVIGPRGAHAASRQIDEGALS